MTLLRLRIWNTWFRHSFPTLLQANFLKKRHQKAKSHLAMPLENSDLNGGDVWLTQAR